MQKKRFARMNQCFTNAHHEISGSWYDRQDIKYSHRYFKIKLSYNFYKFTRINIQKI